MSYYAFEQPRRTGVRPSPVFLLVLAVTVGSGIWVWHAGASTAKTDRAMAFLFVIAAWVVSLSLHEFAHAFSAWRFGDREVEARGYLTLNPLKYSHPVLSILLPLLFIAAGGIGLPGGAVYLHPHQFRTRAQRLTVSLCGPAMNLLAAVAAFVIAALIDRDRSPLLFVSLMFLALLQVSATILNLLPIPGLDGYGAIEPYLKPETQRTLEQFKPYGMLALFAVLWGIPRANDYFFRIVYWFFELSGQNRYYAAVGSIIVRFWKQY